jgi:hypothetical protein
MMTLKHILVATDSRAVGAALTWARARAHVRGDAARPASPTTCRVPSGTEGYFAALPHLQRTSRTSPSGSWTRCSSTTMSRRSRPGGQ